MAKFQFWNPETLEVDETRDDFTVLRTPFDYVEGYFRDVISTEAYIHDRTGIVTTDPVAFEKWLESIER